MSSVKRCVLEYPKNRPHDGMANITVDLFTKEPVSAAFAQTFSPLGKVGFQIMSNCTRLQITKLVDSDEDLIDQVNAIAGVLSREGYQVYPQRTKASCADRRITPRTILDSALPPA